MTKGIDSEKYCLGIAPPPAENKGILHGTVNIFHSRALYEEL
jgi:hypothetical protein